MRPAPGHRLAAALLGPVLGPALGLVLLGAGCGSEPADPPTQQAPEQATQPAAQPELLSLVSQSHVGGEVSALARPLVTEAEIAAFGSQFRDDRMTAAISSTLDVVTVPDGLVAAGAVVAIGCEPPTDAEVELTEDGVRVTAARVKSDRQCLVPVTTVALVAADPGSL